MKLLRSIWNGPFATPPLQHPIAVGWVLLKALETLWRGLLLFGLGVSAVVAVLVLIEAFDRPLSERVDVRLARNNAICRDQMYPLLLTIANRNSVPIGETSISLSAFERGMSDDIAQRDDRNPLALRLVVRPGQARSMCVRSPNAARYASGPVVISATVDYALPVSADVPLEKVDPQAPVFEANQL